jgi:hypothetical protein
VDLFLLGYHVLEKFLIELMVSRIAEHGFAIVLVEVHFLLQLKAVFKSNSLQRIEANQILRHMTGFPVGKLLAYRVL